MQIQNFQQRAWVDLFTRVIDDLAKDASFSFSISDNNAGEPVKVEFSIPKDTKQTFLDIASVSNERKSSFADLKVQVTLQYLGVKASQIIKLIELPRLAQGGLLIDGCRWSLINTTHPASGWYVEPSKKKPGVYNLNLHRGAGIVLSVQADKISKDIPANERNYVVRMRSRNGAEYTIPLAEFLVAIACDATVTTKNIVDKADLADCTTFATTFNKAKEASSVRLEELCTRLVRRLRSKSDQYVPMSATAELKSLLRANYMNIGPERIPRFKRFTSFYRAIGTELSKGINLETRNGERHVVTDSNSVSPFADVKDTYGKSTIISDTIAHDLDGVVDLNEIEVSKNGEVFKLVRMPELTEEITFEEICCALRVYDQVIRGIGTPDDIDDACNKVMYSIREEFSKYIESAFSQCVRAIKQCIRKCGARAESNTDIVQAVIRDFEDNTDKYCINAAFISKKIVGTSYYQQIDETNSLASFDQSYRITSTAANVTHKARDIHPLQYGRICPYTTSESKQVGLNLDMTLGCEIDKYGFCTTPTFEVTPTNPPSERIGKSYKMSAVDEISAVIAPADADLTGDLTSMIPGCRVNGDFRTMPLAEVTHIMANNLQTVGPLIASVPAQNMDAGKRSVMSVSAQRQALIPWRCERPLVTTGLDAVCDIGIQRASSLVEDYIFTNKDAMRDYELAGVLPEILTVVRSTHENGDFVVNFSFILNGNSYSFVSRKHAPSATMKGSIKYTRFNIPRHDKMLYYFKMDDIVFYNSDIDMSNAAALNIDDTVNFGGAMKDCDASELKNHGVAIGANVNVMFKSMNGYTYEDSIVVNEDYLAKQGLAIIKTRTLSYTIGSDRKIDSEYNNTHMQCGLPLNGAYVQPGQEILAVRKTEVTDDKKDEAHLYTLSVGTQGYVLSHELIKDRPNRGSTTILIHLGEILPIGVGDKLTGLHGNKGVIGRIMKSSEMPFTEDGTVPDIILNPLGILARLNIGQIIEFNLGGISRKTGKLEVLEPFSSKGNIKDIIKRAEELGCVEQDVYSGTTGLKLERKALVGTMYFLRVEHTSTSKYNATGDCHENISNRTNQPMRCSGGAQRVSEMGTWCLLSMNATKLLDSLFSVQSDSSHKKEFDKALEAGLDTSSISIDSANMDAVRAYFYMLGLNIDVYNNGTESSTGIRFLTRDDMNARANVSNTPGDLSGLVPVNTSLKASVALHDQNLFGNANTPTNLLTQCYGKLPFGNASTGYSKIIMPALLHTNNLPQLIRAIVVRMKDGSPEILEKSMNKQMFSDLISCSLRTNGFRSGAALVGWSYPVVKDFQRINQLADIGVKVPEGIGVLRVPVLMKISSAADRSALEDAALKLVDFRTATNSKYGIQAAVEIFESYNLYTSLFDMEFTEVSEDSVAIVKEDTETKVNTETLDTDEDALATDLVAATADRDVDIETVVDERREADALADSTIDDDRDVAIDADKSDVEEEVDNLDSAGIEAIIPSFRGIVMMLSSYPAKTPGCVLENFVMDGMLIPPAKFRPVVATDTKRNSPIDVCLNAIYNAVVSLIRATDKNKEATTLYGVIRHQEITGTDKRAPSIISQIKDHKSGTSLLRDTNLSKRVTYSGRSVISIGRDLQFGECGVPVCMLTTIFLNRLAHVYNKNEYFGVTTIAPGNLKRALICLSNKNLFGFRQVFAQLSTEDRGNSNAAHLSTITASEFNKYYAQLVTELESLLVDQPSIMNREPSLHKFSLQGCKVRPTDNYTLLLHPLNCHGFNGDFDGDQMAVHFPMHAAGRKDTEEKVMARKNLVDPKDSSGIVAINQDMILGLYYATIHAKNAKDSATYYSNITFADVKKCYSLPTFGDVVNFSEPKGHSVGVAEQIMSDINAGVVKVHDICLVLYNGLYYLAEAGKFVVNALLPGGTGFTTEPVDPLVVQVLKKNASDKEVAIVAARYPKDAVLKNLPIYRLKVSSQLTKKTINKVINDAIAYFSVYGLEEDTFGDHLADFYNRLMHVGFIMSDISGITLSLYDFGRLPVKEQIKPNLEKTKHEVSVLDKWHDLGFCTDTEYQDAKDKLWVDNVMTSKDIIKKKFADADCATELHSLNPDEFDRNSNIFMIIDSGARGDVSQLLEMAGMIGVVRNAANQQLKDPIFASYMDGLSPMDFASNACTARRQIAAAQLTTAESGAETRDLIYLGEHLHIRKDNYCCKDNDSKHLLRVPCRYTATPEKDSDIYWFAKLKDVSDDDSNTRITLIRSDEQLLDALAVAKNTPELMSSSLLMMYDEHYCNLRQDLDAIGRGEDIPYLEFLHRLNLSNGEGLDDSELAAVYYQRYAYVVKTELVVDDNGEPQRVPVAYGIRAYDFKLSQLTKDMLLWRITKADEIKNNPLTTRVGNKLIHVQEEDKLVDEDGYTDVNPEVLDEQDIIIDLAVLNMIEQNVVHEVPIYSMINCTSTEGICRKCFGITYDSFKLPRKNALIGYSGIQAIANPMTQLILDSHKSEYSGEESAMSKIQRVTSQRHTPELVTGNSLRAIAEAKHSRGIPYLGFAAGEKTVVALDPAAEKGKYIITIIDLWHLQEEGIEYITKASTIASLSALKIGPTVYNGKILSRDNTDEDLLKVLESSTIERGTAITDVSDYGKFMGCAIDLADMNKTDINKLDSLACESRFEYWESLCKCFTNDTILSRNFETFARALTEFGVAESTDLTSGIVKGYTYGISQLIAAGIPYTPVIERRTAARTLAGKIYTDIAYGNPLAHIMYHAVNGTVENKDTYIGREVLGASETTATRVTDFSWRLAVPENVPEYDWNSPVIETDTIEESQAELTSYDEPEDGLEETTSSEDFEMSAPEDSEDLHSNVFGTRR